jgi:signal transduction histidine kinase/DNA-binding NarL/FixJ family response regulator
MVRSPPDQSTPTRTGITWLGVVGFGLMLALLAVALVQARQFALLKQAVQSGEDVAVVSVYQAETDFLRLQDQWRLAADDRVPLDLAALSQHYDTWVRGVRGLLTSRPQRPGQPADAEFARHMAELTRFIAGADIGLGERPEVNATRPFLAARLAALQDLAMPMRSLSLGATQRQVALMAQRAQAVREQNMLGLGLTIFMSLLTLAFAYIALRQVQQLRERRVVLEALAQNLREARHEAEAASAAKSTFLANMSHEIRTPFHGLMGMLSLLREAGLTARQIDLLHTATESADHLLAILNDILDMSQLESGRMTLAPAPVEVRALLRDVEALMRPQAAHKQLALHLDAAPGVPERVVADATRVKQILFNLLSNAIKFSDRGAVVLDVRRCGGQGSQGEIEFVVSDNGPGMDDATLAQIFNRFAQGDSSRSRRFGGTGLGLEISRNLARLMGGDIAVRSKVGEGSVFRFHMPLLLPSQVPAADAALTAAAESQLRRLCVLVAEDHPVNRQYMAALLESLGHTAFFAANGMEAVRAATNQAFDVVLMDLHMPELDGFGATRAIRALADRQRSTVPILALTADAFASTRERCLVCGMNEVLTKPVSPDKLATTLRRLYGAGPAPAPAPSPVAQTALQHALLAGTPPLIDEAAVAMALQVMSPDKLAGLINTFLDQGPQTVQHLRNAVREAQPQALRINAHAVKGAALNLGLAALASVAESLQQGAAHLPAHEIARLVQRYEELLPATRSAALALGLLPGSAAPGNKPGTSALGPKPLAPAPPTK